MSARPMVLLLLAACNRDVPQPADHDSTPGETQDTGTFADDGPGPCSTVANLEIVPLDIWGRDLEGVSLTMDRTPTYVEAQDLGPGVVILRYGDSGVDLRLRLEATDHLDLVTTVSFDGKGTFSVSDPEGAGRIATSEETRVIDRTDCPITTIYLGLDHAWLAAQGRAPTHNEVDLLMDGEDFWASVAEDLDDTQRRVTWATWWWMSEFELERPEGQLSMSDATRWRHTAMGHFEELDGVERRVLINRFWDENSDWTEYLNTDSELRDAADTKNDDFEVILQGNPTEVPISDEYVGEPAAWDFGERVAANPRYADRDLGSKSPQLILLDASLQVASFHQKGLVIDGEVAFVTGMNTKSTDWDSSEHLVYEPRRMNYDASTSDREAVDAGEILPDLGPRKDYGIRVEGPAARDVEEIFWDRWETAIDGNDLYASNATRFDLDEAAAEPAGGVLTQVVATLPEPWADMSIGETHGKAFAAATRYIYIEDQYFRAPIMNDLIVEAMDANPDLVLIVVTKPVSRYDGGAKYTYLSDAEFRERYPDRYLLLQLRALDLYLEVGWLWDTVELQAIDMDTHSKIRIIDDRYVSVGSCNFNNRGYKYEGELDVSVLDEDFAIDARERVFENLVGSEWAGMLSDDPKNNLDVFALAAESNQEILDWWEDNGGDFNVDEAVDEWRSRAPSGFVYPLEIDDNYAFDVGPDAF